MSQTSVGLYSGEGDMIIEYNEFDATDIQYLNVATGWGSDGSWTIQPSTCTPGNYIHTLRCTDNISNPLFVEKSI